MRARPSYIYSYTIVSGSNFNSRGRRFVINVTSSFLFEDHGCPDGPDHPFADDFSSQNEDEKIIRSEKVNVIHVVIFVKHLNNWL